MQDGSHSGLAAKGRQHASKWPHVHALTHTHGHTDMWHTHCFCFCHLVGQRDLVISCCGLPGVYLITQAVKHCVKRTQKRTRTRTRITNANCELRTGNCNKAVGAKGERSTARWHVRLIKASDLWLLGRLARLSLSLSSLVVLQMGFLIKECPSKVVVRLPIWCASVEGNTRVAYSWRTVWADGWRVAFINCRQLIAATAFKTQRVAS